MVAVKEIPVGHEMARRAGAEVRAACRLDHPGLVRLLDFGEDSYAAYLVSELVVGTTLAERLREGSIDDQAIVRVMADVFAGLAHAHGRQVTHRDIKPGNILVDHSGAAKVTDFGIARILGDRSLTQTGGLVGTVAYMAPEQISDGSAGPASDVYSASLVLREGLTGHNPVAAGDHIQTLRRAHRGVVPSLESERPDLPRALCALVDSGLARDPERRPSAAEVAQTLGRLADNGIRDRIVVPKRPAGGRSTKHATPTPGRLGSGALVAIGVWLLATHTMAGTPGTHAAAALVVGGLFVVFPWLTTLIAGAIAVGALAREAPALAGIVAVIGIGVLLPFRRRGHLLSIPIIAPAIAAAGLGPLWAFMAGSVHGWTRRISAALSAALSVLIWQVVMGSEHATDGGRLIGAWPEIRGSSDPRHVLSEMGSVISARPTVAVAAAALAGGALVIPAVMRVRRGIPRTIAVGIWTTAIIGVIAVAGGSVENAIGAMLPGGILVAVGAAVPWQRLRVAARPPEAVTLSGNMERTPTA